MVDRVATHSLQQTNLRYISSIESDLATLNQQISSGKKATTYDQLNGVVEQVSGYQTEVDKINNYSSNNTILNSNLNLMDEALNQIGTIAGKYQALVAGQNGATNDSQDFVNQAQSYLTQVVSLLNTTDGNGNYIFSGSRTNTPTVSTPLPGLASDNQPSASYYQGNGDIATARISDSQEISYGVLGSNPAFQNVIAAIQQGIAGATSSSQSGSSSSGQDLISSSVDLIASAIQQVASVRVGVDDNVTAIKNTTDEQTQLQTYWQQSLSDNEDTDIAAASIQLSSDQTLLQATFQAFATISKLKLSDYLNN